MRTDIYHSEGAGKPRIDQEELEERLVAQNVRPTAVRLMLAKILQNADLPMSALDIEIALDTVDRSTITRTLAIFGERGLVHVVDDRSGAPKYEWCRNPHTHNPSDNHPHFHCIRCRRTICLHGIPMPAASLPDGFEIHDSSFLISGLCPDCTSDS